MSLTMQTKTKRFKAILDSVKAFLDKLQDLKNPEAEYLKAIQQEAEYLHDFINYSIFDIDMYNSIKDIYKQIIGLMNNSPSHCADLLGELYYTFRYLMESIMFLIENEYLIK